MHRQLAMIVVMILMNGCATPNTFRSHVESAAQGAHVELKGDWIVAQQGGNENSQVVSLKIWGSLRDPSHFEHGFRKLYGDGESQYVVVSRNDGTGPYYRIQIIDFRPDGILTWSYESHGKPRIQDNLVCIGRMKGAKYEGAGTEILYTAFRFTKMGLMPLEL